MDDLGDKLKAMLSDESSFNQIMSLAKALGSQNAPGSRSESQDTPDTVENADKNISPEASSLLDMPQIKAIFVDGANDRANLLKALRPYLREERRIKADQISRAMSAVSALYSAKDIL